jgi:hypothetical protein
MKKIIFLLFFCVSIMLSVSLACAAPTPIYNPGFMIDSPGDYVLNNSFVVTESHLVGLLIYNTSDVTLNLSGHTISGSDESLFGEGGIYIINSENISVIGDNGFLKNFNFSFSSGIYLENSSNVSIHNITLENNYFGVSANNVSFDILFFNTTFSINEFALYSDIASSFDDFSIIYDHATFLDNAFMLINVLSLDPLFSLVFDFELAGADVIFNAISSDVSPEEDSAFNVTVLIDDLIFYLGNSTITIPQNTTLKKKRWFTNDYC